MNDEQMSAQAEGDVLSGSGAPHPLAGRITGAIERWYAAHFNGAARSGRSPISAEEKASLTAHVTEALTQKE